MAINQTIQTPLTLFSGSLSAHTVAAGATQGQLMSIISSSLPIFTSPFWEYKIKTDVTYTTSNVLTTVNDLAVVTSDTTSYYLILGYYGMGCSSVTTGVRLGSVFASYRDSNITTESPDTRTSYVVSWDGSTTATTTSPSSDVDNFYMYRHIIIAKPNASTANFRPTFAVSAIGTGVTASMGPSIVLWTKFTTA